jgi:peptidoglycan/xylan/chitin deacetylase (PgdA/CDA1 family)
MFLDVEERAGARSANYIVPCGWPIDHGLVGEIHTRGHEIGVHGFDHANRTPFVEADERRRRIDAARGLIERYAIRGYRAPSLLRTPELLSDLADLYSYDSSIPTSGGVFPVPNNGCASARPFRIGGLIEIPVSMPRDGSLRFLGYRPAEVLQTWLDVADLISRSGGVIVVLTHCEERFSGNPEMLAVYGCLLDHFADDRRFLFSTTSEVLARHAVHESISEPRGECARAGL